MVFAPIFKSSLHLSLQKQQNKVMLFKHVGTTFIGSTDHLFQAVTWPGAALSSRAAPASWLLLMVWAVLIHCSVLQPLSGDKGSSAHHSPALQDGGVLLPGRLQHVLGSLPRPGRSALCQMCSVSPRIS